MFAAQVQANMPSLQYKTFGNEPNQVYKISIPVKMLIPVGATYDASVTKLASYCAGGPVEFNFYDRFDDVLLLSAVQCK